MIFQKKRHLTIFFEKVKIFQIFFGRSLEYVISNTKLKFQIFWIFRWSDFANFWQNLGSKILRVLNLLKFKYLAYFKSDFQNSFCVIFLHIILKEPAEKPTNLTCFSVPAAKRVLFFSSKNRLKNLQTAFHQAKLSIFPNLKVLLISIYSLVSKNHVEPVKQVAFWWVLAIWVKGFESIAKSKFH